jgi:hypothetical protein
MNCKAEIPRGGKKGLPGKVVAVVNQKVTQIAKSDGAEVENKVWTKAQVPARSPKNNEGWCKSREGELQ